MHVCMASQLVMSLLMEQPKVLGLTLVMWLAWALALECVHAQAFALASAKVWTLVSNLLLPRHVDDPAKPFLVVMEITSAV